MDSGRLWYTYTCSNRSDSEHSGLGQYTNFVPV